MQNRQEQAWAPHHASLYAIGNGHIGTRACAHELKRGIAGTFINGFYDLRPFTHAEWAYGYPAEREQMVQIPEPLVLSIQLDGEPVDPAQVKDWEESLDIRSGIYKRSYRVQNARIQIEKIVSFVHKELLALRVEVAYPGEIALGIRTGTPKTGQEERQDPRVEDERVPLEPLPPVETPPWTAYRWQTLPSKKPLSIALRGGGTRTGAGHLTTEAFAVVRTEDNGTDPLLKPAQMTFSDCAKEQRAFVEAFWADVTLQAENEEANEALRWSLFQLLQSAGTDGASNIAAKGLTGEGYGGHTFWDTEMYMLPVFQQFAPETAQALLTYRYRMLPAARKRARELGHKKGAAYPWRTIAGRESSGYVPAGTAQYHLHADIAWSFIRHWLLTKDTEFLFAQAAEVVIETARIFLAIGNFTETGFHIHGVTGPDEYTAHISDNYFTNRLARHNLLWAKKIVDILQKKDPARTENLLQRLDASEEELARMQRAGEDMVLLFDHKRGIRKQDDSFLEKPEWPFDETPASMYPLLLHVHPLTIYRHQVLKQADTVLCNVLFPEGPVSVRVRDYEYYESRTTHDSSLSACAHAMAAAQIGKWDEAEKHLQESLLLDRHNTHNNTEHGLHMANLGGTLLTVTRGFGGLRFSEEGFSLSPAACPTLGAYAFSFWWEGRKIEVAVEEKIRIHSPDASSIPFRLYGEWQELHGKAVFPLRNARTKAVLFDMDGVLTDTAPLHYAAWKQLAEEELHFHLPAEYQQKLAGVSRRKALQAVLEYGKRENRFTEEEQIRLTTIKNEYYQEKIRSFTPDDLFPGARKLLEELREKGVKTALVSASRNAQTLVEKLQIGHLFDAVAHPDHAGRPKPAPDPFLHAAALLGVLPVNCVGVEDAEAGIQSIRAAGMWELGIGDKETLGTLHAVPHIRYAAPLLNDWLEGKTWQM